MEFEKMKPYGKELILDLHNCNVDKFTRDSIEEYIYTLCSKINVERGDGVFWWDYQEENISCVSDPVHLIGTSALQFIRTSTIVIHTLDILGNAYIDIFSCDDFDAMKVSQFTVDWFKGRIVNERGIDRI
jgi:S-adenosylmethionine/arginine decarboxylase-like enzyme